MFVKEPQIMNVDDGPSMLDLTSSKNEEILRKYIIKFKI